ncbi:hypothetical protein BGW80DRAFT_847452 [Lactifluus volemus]|nr:hypothetical protein BGW80DRAFT_847452 [Lactifluus volemus]
MLLRCPLWQVDRWYADGRIKPRRPSWFVSHLSTLSLLYLDISSCKMHSPSNTLVGSAIARVPDNFCMSKSRLIVCPIASRNPVSIFCRRISRFEKPPINETTGARRGLRGVLQIHNVFAPGDTSGQPCAELSVWSHNRIKCANIRRPDASEGVFRVKMDDSLTHVTIFLPSDFHGVVRRLGHSGGSISCSRAALILKESDNLRFSGVADGTEDQVLVRTEKTLHICVEGDDPLLPRTGCTRWHGSKHMCRERTPAGKPARKHKPHLKAVGRWTIFKVRLADRELNSL